MQVSFHGEVEDHVVIGGGVAQACGVDDSAEFLDMLSDTIYREKALAAVREPICNAWDAHIAAGKTDVPLVITLADNKLTIQDFGAGIPAEKMLEIYGIYGRSTKKKDSTQTGGFGIGSKAPWAYSKHFTVTSAHNGTRTIYAMSKGLTENDGKPDIRTITSVPCDQSGLTVTIPIKDEDLKKFDTLVRSVVVGGGIRAVLNGELLPYRDYETGRSMGFVMVQANDNFVGGNVGVLVGTVLYPLNTEDEAVCSLLNKLRNYIPSGYRVVLLAEPNTISIAPSRESLSYGDRTLQAVADLLDKAIKVVTRLRMNSRILKAIIQKGVKINASTTVDFVLPTIKELLEEDAYKANVLADKTSISMLQSLKYVSDNLGNGYIRTPDLTKYTLDHLKRTDRSRKAFWKKLALQGRNSISFHVHGKDLLKQTIRRIAKKAAKMDLVKEITLFHRASFKRFDIRRSQTDNYQSFDGFISKSYEEKPIFIMGCLAGVIRDYISNARLEFDGRNILPILNVNKNRKDDARIFAKFMQDAGFEVVDLLDREPVRKAAPKNEKTVATNLFFQVNGLNNHYDADMPYIGVPKHFIHIPPRKGQVDTAWSHTYNICTDIAEIVPDTCVIFTSEARREAEQLGMTSAVEIALDNAEKAVKADSPAIFEYLRLRKNVVKGVTKYNAGYRNCICGLNNIIHSLPYVAAMLHGKKTAHKVSDKEQAIGCLLSDIHKLKEIYDARFRGRNSAHHDRMIEIATVLSGADSRYRIDGEKLLDQCPALLLCDFNVVSMGLRKKISEKSVHTIIRAFMKA